MKQQMQMQVPAIGQQQPQFDPAQAIPNQCICGSELFIQAFRLGNLSRLATGNKTGQGLTVRFEVFVCKSCGLEVGK